MTKKRDPRSEAAQREACKRLADGSGYRSWSRFATEPYLKPYEVAVRCNTTGERVAIFDLRQCFRQRAPLKGIKKAMAKAISPKRKAKKR